MKAVIFAACLLAAPAWAQFQISIVDPSGERPAAALYDFGSIYANETATAQFRLRNISAAAARVTTLAAAGAGFTLAGPNLPLTLDPQGSFLFTVAFRATDTGSYSAGLRSDGISILLTATVLPRLTLTGSFDFGSVARGASAQNRFTLTNQTPQVLIVPAIAVSGADFSLAGAPPSGQAYAPLGSGSFTVVFTPQTAGASKGTLTVGDRTYALTGIGSDPPLPKPFLTIDLKQIASRQQGMAIIRFDTPAKVSGTGSLTLAFSGPSDPTVAFASGGRTAAFTVQPGDMQASIPFQTGTTAGKLTFTAQLGGTSDQLTVTIPNSPAGVSEARGARSAASVEVDVTGFDNTRTLGALSFTFFNAAGGVLGTGTIQANAAADFAQYFAGSETGGAFLLRAVFPVTGDVSQIASCDVAMTNSAGSTKAPRVTF